MKRDQRRERMYRIDGNRDGKQHRTGASSDKRREIEWGKKQFIIGTVWRRSAKHTCTRIDGSQRLRTMQHCTTLRKVRSQ